MKKQKLSYRTGLLILLVLLLPVLFIIYSPVLMAVGVLNGMITLSAFVFLTWFILSLFLGRAAACGYTCPYGALQEICGDKILNKKAGKGKGDYLKYVLFLAFLIIATSSMLTLRKIQGLDLFLTQGIYQGLAGQQWSLLIPLSIVFMGTMSIIFGSRAFCRYLCPQGVFLAIGSEFGSKLNTKFLKLTSDEEKCSKCDICNNACPMGIKVSQMVNDNIMEDTNCILCGECADACPKDALEYSFKTSW